jgi:lipoyl(octanoyl) transferase
MAAEWEVVDVGTMAFGECWELQQRLFEEAIGEKKAGRTPRQKIILVEHPPVYTLGKSGKQSNMLIPQSYLESLGAEFFHIDRGGDITFHGPGQIVCYPILDIEQLGIGLRRYIEILEEAVITTVAHYGIVAERLAGATGVWICDRDDNGEPKNWRKICAIGVRASHFVTMHGLALNVATDLKWFTMINPCGFTDKGVTSISKEVGDSVDFEQVKQLLVENLTKLLVDEK